MRLINFILIQLFTVIFSTIKSIITIKGKPIIAALINALYYSLYYYFIKLVTEEDLFIVITVAFFTNFLGVIVGRLIIDSLEKDKLWVYNLFIKCDEDKAFDIKQQYESLDCYCVYEAVKENKFYSFKIFANNRYKSNKVYEMINKFNIKYYITESK